MKKLISILSFVLFMGIVAVSVQSCNGATADNSNSTKVARVENQKSTSDVKVYYFHGTIRCATCNAVEEVSKTYIKDVYGDKVSFQSLNIDDDVSKTLVEKYKISGQSLMIVKDEEMVNLTNDAFLNARTKPEKLESKIKETIDSMM